MLIGCSHYILPLWASKISLIAQKSRKEVSDFHSLRYACSNGYSQRMIIPGKINQQYNPGQYNTGSNNRHHLLSALPTPFGVKPCGADIGFLSND